MEKSKREMEKGWKWGERAGDLGVIRKREGGKDD